MKYTLAEARKKFIGKKFRVTHAERGGNYMPYYIENVVGVCTWIDSYWYEFEGKKRHFFQWRIESPGMYEKWFSTHEIELVK